MSLFERTAVLGINFGDEGKGRIVHELSKDYNWVVRFAGGANAGHTIYRDGKKYVHNLLPSVDFRQAHVNSFLASGMVIDLEQLLKEVKTAARDFPGVGYRVYVDPDAFVVLPEHKEEDKAKNGHIGSTNRGIGPAYVAKMDRRGTRIRDLFDKPSEPDYIAQLRELGVQFASVRDLRDEFKHSHIMYEGAQGVMLDLNHGTYPYVSCGDCTVAGIFTSGFSFAMPKKVYGVTKAYLTRVGEGPFPTEIFGEEAEALRKLGNEYGATTGRPRRIGWLDVPTIRYAAAKAGITSLIVTKLDILNGAPTVKVCQDYENGEPACGKDFFTAKPKFVELTGWKEAPGAPEMQDFLRKLSNSAELPISYISYGTSADSLAEWRWL